jgi:hypothetical protein
MGGGLPKASAAPGASSTELVVGVKATEAPQRAATVATMKISIVFIFESLF